LLEGGTLRLAFAPLRPIIIAPLLATTVDAQRGMVPAAVVHVPRGGMGGFSA